MAKQVNYVAAHPTYVVHVLATACPKRPGTKSAAYWGLYKTGQTVAQYAAAHAAKGAAFTPNATLNWDKERNYIAILPSGQQPQAPAPAKGK